MIFITAVGPTLLGDGQAWVAVSWDEGKLDGKVGPTLEAAINTLATTLPVTCEASLAGTAGPLPHEMREAVAMMRKKDLERPRVG